MNIRFESFRLLRRRRPRRRRLFLGPVEIDWFTLSVFAAIGFGYWLTWHAVFRPLLVLAGWMQP